MLMSLWLKKLKSKTKTMVNNQNSIQSKKTVKSNQNVKSPYIFAVGRRKEAIAKVRLYDPRSGEIEMDGEKYHKGDLIVNGKPIGEYFRMRSSISEYKKIFDDTDSWGKYIWTVKVNGGGLLGQLDAVIHGVARALDKQDTKKHHKILRDKGYLTRDARTRERRKVGMGGKARRKRQSPKR